MRASLNSLQTLLVFLGGYVGCVFYYAYCSFIKIYTEYLKKSALSRASFFQLAPVVAFEHVKDDPFNALDLFSIFCSFFSLTQFAIFVQMTMGYSSQSGFSYVVRTEPWATLLSTLGDIKNQNKVYTRLSSLNIVVIFLRLLKFFRERPRMTNLSATIAGAAVDTCYFVMMMMFIMFGFVLFCHVSFGPQLDRLSTIYEAFNYCFGMIIGDYNFSELNAVDSLMAHFFFFFFLIIFQCVFLNIFFAIIDCFFVNTSPPPANG